MDSGILSAMNDGLYPNTWMMIEGIALITIIFAVAGFAICLAGIAWLCFEETRRPARRQVKPTPEPPEPDEYDLLVDTCTAESGNEPSDRSAAPARIWKKVNETPFGIQI